MPLIEGATVVTIYQTFGAWEETKGSFTIEAVGAEDALPTHPSTEHVIASLDEAAADVADVIGYWLETRGKREADLQANSMATEPQHIQVAALDTFFSHGRYEIDDDHVVVIDLVAPEDARYFGFTLYNAWAQAMDFMHRQISLNDAEAVPDTDGHHRLVIATRDPGVVNWLDASGHPNGTFNWRVTGPTAPAAPTVRLVPLAELDDVLPQGHPRATPARRAEQLRARRVNMAQRFSS
ncbi:hypothetical protein [Nocardioides alcanivorans]|uniref:hypothetical protein n=1 Tax=Nocardioides alcanivorans TaxID=2897352 RepID=UPI001F38F35B|nr:hypothetical protein [Nocardioides alcanivorans]